jgi:hypothetical protein
VHKYAGIKGVRVDAVRFSDEFPYHGWAACNEYVVAFNRSALEEAWVYPYIPAIAAHEVCHIYYKDNLPCGTRASVNVEERAEACAREML